MPGDDGRQPGDPAAAAALQALDSDRPPLRLALGEDAVNGIAAPWRTRRRNWPRGSGSAARRVFD
ncbi:hypothetical protein [Mycobacterium sp. URHB0021]